jgi:hypothetical protein
MTTVGYTGITNEGEYREMVIIAGSVHAIEKHNGKRGPSNLAFPAALTGDEIVKGSAKGSGHREGRYVKSMPDAK